MIRPRHLDKAPIKEALIDIRFSMPEEQLKGAVADIRGEITKNFPHEMPIRQSGLTIEIQSDEKVSAATDQMAVGTRFDSEDHKHIVQFRTNGFTFSRLEPYETWESMRDQALTCWDLFLQRAQVAVISRLALRYINVINLPVGANLDNYFTCAPRIPDALPQGMQSFLTRVVIQNQAIESVCILTHACEVVTTNNVPVILDIDVISERPFDSPKKCIERLEDLRSFKNAVFFESVTEQTAELCI